MSRGIRPISHAEMGGAVRDGSPVLLGFPVRIKRENGEVAVLDLAAARRGETDPYHVTRIEGTCLTLSTSADRLLAIAGLEVSAQDTPAYCRALALRPDADGRHDAESDARRLAAGQAAMEITDAMVRARTLDAVDGWAALRHKAKRVDAGTDGELLEPDPALELRCRVLIVTCPSTSRVYALRVPQEMQTAREARLWSMQVSEVPEVES